jgi:two-component system sensor histidine kinase ChvG
VDLPDLLAQVVESARLRSDGLQLDPERLSQVFGNVLDNAASFSPPGGTVTVSLTEEDGKVRVIVEDQGPGIPEPHLERIFDRFFSYRPGEPKARNARDGHTGLGLAIVKAIVEGYGGSVAAANRPDGGARLEIRLPRIN